MLREAKQPFLENSTPFMKPTNVKAAAQNAEQTVRVAIEQVKAAEKKARAAKEKAWRAKLLFKLARRASKKAKKAAKRARTKAVQAQIALKELNEQIAPPTRLSVRTGRSAPEPKRNAPSQSSIARAKRRLATEPSNVGVKPLRASARRRPAQTGSASKSMKASAAARSAKRRAQTVAAAEQAGVEPVSPPGARRESKEPTGLGDFGENKTRPVPASSESPAETPH